MQWSQLSFKPLVLIALALLMLALAWLPTGSYSPAERNDKPKLYFTIASASHVAELLPEASQAYDNLAFDLRDRITARHEWKVVEHPESYAWRLDIQIDTAADLYQVAVALTPPQLQAAEAQLFRFEAEKSAAAVIPTQLMKVIIAKVETQ